MMNNEINYMIDKIKFEEFKIKLNRRKRTRNITRRSDVNMISGYSNSNVDLSNSDLKKELGINQLIKNLTNNNLDGNKEYIPEKPVENIEIEIKNEFLLKIKKFFEDFQNHINKNIQNEIKFDSKNRKKFFIKS